MSRWNGLMGASQRLIDDGLVGRRVGARIIPITIKNNEITAHLRRSNQSVVKFSQ